MPQISVDAEKLIVLVGECYHCVMCSQQGVFRTAISHEKGCPIRELFPTPTAGVTAYLSLIYGPVGEPVEIIGEDITTRNDVRIPVRMSKGNVAAINKNYIHKTWEAAKAHVIAQLQQRVASSHEEWMKATLELDSVVALKCPYTEKNHA